MSDKEIPQITVSDVVIEMAIKNLQLGKPVIANATIHRGKDLIFEDENHGLVIYNCAIEGERHSRTKEEHR